jgi:hypothetical protein
VVAPALTVTEDGTVTTGLPLESDTVEPPLGAAWFSVTVQVELPGALMVLGAQLRPDTSTGEGMVMEPPEPAMARPVPDPDTEEAPVTPMATVPDAFADNVTLTVATAPSCIAFAFIPATRQVVAFVNEAQATDLPAASAVEPAATVTAETAAGL